MNKVSIHKIPDNAFLYKYNNYKKGLELINDNVPLNIVKCRLNKYIVEMYEDVKKSVISDCKLKQRVFKFVLIDPRSDIVCNKCKYNPNYHPVGCN